MPGRCRARCDSSAAPVAGLVARRPRRRRSEGCRAAFAANRCARQASTPPEHTSRAAQCSSGGPGSLGDGQRPRWSDQQPTPGSGESREDEPTAIQWTLWGKQAENAAQYLGTGSHVNVIGRLRNHHYTDAGGNTVFGFSFTCEEIDYLDSKADAEARSRARGSTRIKRLRRRLGPGSPKVCPGRTVRKTVRWPTTWVGSSPERSPSIPGADSRRRLTCKTGLESSTDQRRLR